MKININTKVEVPVEIGDLKFSLPLDDESIKKYVNGKELLLDGIEVSNEDDVEQLKKAFKSIVDFFLGEGSFDVIYEKYPSVFICGEIIDQLVVMVAEEISKRGSSFGKTSKLDKYLKKNKK